MGMTVIVPTRGRPKKIEVQMKALAAAQSLCTVIYCVDKDDPEVKNYIELFALGNAPYQFAILNVGESAKLGPWLNRMAPMLARKLPDHLIGFMGDDHVPRTHRWDKVLEDATKDQPAIAYGNDLFQGPNLPTAVFMTANIVTALGYMVPADLTHLYLDDAWKALGLMSGTLRYFGGVIIEHMHPAAGKAESDERYSIVNSPEMYSTDGAKYQQWLNSGKANQDAARIVALMD